MFLLLLLTAHISYIHAHRKCVLLQDFIVEASESELWFHCICSYSLHRRFLLGLLKYGKGDWRNISRNFVVTKTPTQVASHAQKYFLRQHSGVKEKRRPSIHDFTTINLTESSSPSENNANITFWDQSSVIPPLQMYGEEAQKVLLDWNIPSEEALMVLGSTCGNLFMSSPYNVSSPSGLKLPLDQNLYAGARYAARTKPQASMFELQTSGYY